MKIRMQTSHQFFFKNAQSMSELPDDSVHLVVTSPPYPMIELWNEAFSSQNSKIGYYLARNNGEKAFELMHLELDKVWKECMRVLQPGGFLCINIGDATLSMNNTFQLYPNHARIQQSLFSLGLNVLPSIIWRKQSNKPTKFMGSGMLPAGAYVTLEHEYVLIFRKGNKREFSPKETELRRQSAIFWEERNQWYSDIWFDLKGETQILEKSNRDRSAAYPLELVHRLILMYSIQGDTICDPFLGTGTTTLAAMINGRSSVGFEIDPSFCEVIESKLKQVQRINKSMVTKRLQKHESFISETSRSLVKGYMVQNYDLPVITKQEQQITLPLISKVQNSGKNKYKVTYKV